MNRLVFVKALVIVFILSVMIGHAQVVQMPDKQLEQSVREVLALPDGSPVTQQSLSLLKSLRASNREIADLTGLEHAENLELLSVWGNPISDLMPLSNLTKLKRLDLGGCNVSDIAPLANLTRLTYLTLHWNRLIVDISPLANLTQLTQLRLTGNRIVDISPLSNLTMLEELWIAKNRIIDFSPIDGLPLKVFHKDEPCVTADLPVEPRMDNRSFPSIFRAWSPITNLPELSDEDRTAHHDLYWHGLPFGSFWLQTDSGYHLMCDIERAKSMRDELLARNPNMLFLASIPYRNAILDHHYPEDWFGWVRDENSHLVTGWWDLSGRKVILVDFTLPAVQDVIVQKAVAIAKSGLYDGIVFDWWHENHITLKDWHDPSKRYSTEEKELAARLSFVQRIRENVPDDFLIIGNTNRRKIPVTAPYINGGYMETGRDHDGGYTHEGIIQIESSLVWLDEHLREPRVTCLEGWGVGHEPPDSPTNKRWMRVFTTMSLTHSDGYVMYNQGGILFGIGDHAHIWHDFWAANLGRPVGPKAQCYQDIDGLYIREFTNGWAVYNRSGKEQAITLPRVSRGVSSSKQDITHLLPDLDGEIYLRRGKPYDLNRDGVVNVLDLIGISQSFGTTEGDINGDGVTNVLDLTLVAQQFAKE